MIESLSLGLEKAYQGQKKIAIGMYKKGFNTEAVNFLQGYLRKALKD
jgi:hypothetical protein